MIPKMKLLGQLIDSGVVAVVRADNSARFDDVDKVR